VAIKDLISYLFNGESLVERGAEVMLPTHFGEFRIVPFKQKSNGVEHVALIKGTWGPDEPLLTRVHSSCMTGDIFGSMRCECGDQLHKAMKMIEKEGKGVIVYMMQEGRGIGLFNKIAAYKLQDQGLDTVEANVHLGFNPDERDYGVGAQILSSLGVSKMKLLTNNPVKRVGLEGYGLHVTQVIPLEVEPNEFNQKYMKTKRDRMGHHLKGFDYDV
jgi:3,4-dihydroxy 2-butanone 4-phosphate synthase/GTP cyclohydrolase II